MQIAIPMYALGMTIQEEAWSGTRQFAYVYSATFATSELLKMTIKEKRPNGNDYRSFPSSHTASAFTGAFFIHKRYGWRRALIPYALAIITGYSRIASNFHHTHDVFAGAAVAGLWTLALADRHVPVQIAADFNGVHISGKVRF